MMDANGKIPEARLPEGIGGGYEVGDMLTTVRSNLDDTWLLCNGESISSAEYPELAPLCPSAMIGKWSDEIDATFTSVTDAIAANGYFVVLNSSSKKPILYDQSFNRKLDNCIFALYYNPFYDSIP